MSIIPVNEPGGKLHKKAFYDKTHGDNKTC